MSVKIRHVVCNDGEHLASEIITGYILTVTGCDAHGSSPVYDVMMWHRILQSIFKKQSSLRLNNHQRLLGTLVAPAVVRSSPQSMASIAHSSSDFGAAAEIVVGVCSCFVAKYFNDFSYQKFRNFSFFPLFLLHIFIDIQVS